MGEQGRFLAARATADLHNHVFSVVFVLWQQKQLEFLLQRFQLFLVFGQLLLYHFLKVRLQAAFVQQLLRLPAGFFGLLVFVHRLDQGREILVFPHQIPEQLVVADGGGVLQSAVHLVVTKAYIAQFFQHGQFLLFCEK